MIPGFPKQGHALGSGREAVLRDVRKDGQLPDRSERSSCWRTRNTYRFSGWRLYSPESSAKDAKRRREAGIPEEIVFREKWELALEIIDQIREWGLPDEWCWAMPARRWHRVPRRIGKAGTEIRRGCPAASRSMAEADQDHPAENYRQRAATDCGPLWGSTSRPPRKSG